MLVEVMGTPDVVTFDGALEVVVEVIFPAPHEATINDSDAPTIDVDIAFFKRLVSN